MRFEPLRTRAAHIVQLRPIGVPQGPQDFSEYGQKIHPSTSYPMFLSSAGEDRGGDPRSSELANPAYRADELTCCTNLKLLAQPPVGRPRVLRNVSPFLRRTSKVCL